MTFCSIIIQTEGDVTVYFPQIFAACKYLQLKLMIKEVDYRLAINSRNTYLKPQKSTDFIFTR